MDLVLSLNHIHQQHKLLLNDQNKMAMNDLQEERERRKRERERRKRVGEGGKKREQWGEEEKQERDLDY